MERVLTEASWGGGGTVEEGDRDAVQQQVGELRKGGSRSPGPPRPGPTLVGVGMQSSPPTSARLWGAGCQASLCSLPHRCGHGPTLHPGFPRRR